MMDMLPGKEEMPESSPLTPLIITLINLVRLTFESDKQGL